MSLASFALFENRLAAPGETAAWLFESLLDVRVVCDLAEVSRLEAEWAAMPGWSVLAIDYEFGRQCEPVLAGVAKPAPSFRYWRFASCQALSSEECADWLSARLADLPEDERLAGVGGLQAALTEKDYCQALERIQRYIAAGDCYQVNYTFPLSFTHFGHPLALYAALRQRQPVRYGGILLDADGAIVSLSPELFLERRGERLITRPMKGTAARQSDPETLRSCEKNCAENLMIVDLLRNDLGRVARTGSVQVDSLFEIEAYPTVWQMVSQVSATLLPETGLAAILRALFPCGSITGAPKIRAMQIAAELEVGERGLYTGAFGWLAPDGDFRLNVAIRTLSLQADGLGRLGVGSGIVSDSDPEDEWRECWLKAAFLRDLDPGLQLIETLRRHADGRYPRLEGHLARLRHSAAWFAFPFDEAAIREALQAWHGEGEQRVRLLLDKSGRLELSASALLPDPPGRAWQVLLARAPLAADNPLRQHKTTVRCRYDRDLAQLAAWPEVFDVIYLNQRGELAEGARSSVFVERDGILLTPPLTSGALPGVLRAELLAAGRAREAVLWPDDLRAGFWVGNALRGLIPVRWEGGWL